MKQLILLSFPFILFSCSGQKTDEKNAIQLESEETTKVQPDLSSVDQYYQKNKQDSIIGKSIGSVSNGSLENGTLLPYSGKNYQYFDTTSYLSGRAFTHQRVAQTILETYTNLDKLTNRKWELMELSKEHGGKIFPHRTHQNGMSVDFMTPLLKNGKTYYGLDNLGAQHYMLEFDNSGRYTKDSSISIDFDEIARHLLVLNDAARAHGLKIEKVIFKMELKDELYATPHGKELKQSGIYITRNLSPLINSLHDDHYHVDFSLL